MAVYGSGVVGAGTVSPHIPDAHPLNGHPQYARRAALQGC